jgi:oligopeptide/dipeptide ABC transporter ATP-binding protein
MSGHLLVVSDLVKEFPLRGGLLRRRVGAVHALNGISFAVPRGKTLSLVGESGSGKTTAGRVILRLIEPSAGRVVFDGQDMAGLDRRTLRALRRRMQIIFQDPYASLNPRMTVYSVLAEAIRAHRLRTAAELPGRVAELLEMVGLPPEAAARYPHEFSGGQRQRIGIARALAVEPDLIVADEPVSALDVSIQAQILNLMRDLQARLGLTYLFIGHNLGVVRHISDFVAVLYLGKIVEMGTMEEVFDRPVHPYTRALLAAVPVPDPARRGERKVLQGDVPSPIALPSGCAFHPRCPEARPDCAARTPSLCAVAPGHTAACWVHAPADRAPEGPAAP